MGRKKPHSHLSKNTWAKSSHSSKQETIGRGWGINEIKKKNQQHRLLTSWSFFPERTPEGKVIECPWVCQLWKTRLCEQISQQWSVQQPDISERHGHLSSTLWGISHKLVKQGSARPRIKTNLNLVVLLTLLLSQDIKKTKKQTKQQKPKQLHKT